MVVAGGGQSGEKEERERAREGFKVAVVADRIGGQVLDTTAIENFTSVPVIQGKELGADLRTHMSKYPISISDQREIEFV